MTTAPDTGEAVPGGGRAAPLQVPGPQNAVLRCRRAGQRLSRAYWCLHDTLLAERGYPFEGTPARNPEDIANFIVHAAFHRIEGLPPPPALGRPGVCRTAWFAGPATARKMAARHPFGAEAGLFDEMAARIPESVMTDRANIIASGRIGADDAYAVFAAEVAEGTGGFLYSGITVAGGLAALTVFKKAPETDLYKVLWTGVADSVFPARSRPGIGRPFRRLVRRYQLMIRQYPEACIDFMGTITPAAALMGHALFKHLRKAEMARLRALGENEYRAVRCQVAAYPYPRFEPARLVRPAQILGGAVVRAREAVAARINFWLGKC